MKMNIKAAIKVAKISAKKQKEIMYIVISDEYDSGMEYHIASDFDLETFYLGHDPVAAVDQYGTVWKD